MLRFIVLVLMLVSAPAFADVKAYNAAVKAGDFATASAEAEQVWKTFDRTDPSIAIIAREFAWTAMRAKQPARAAVYSKWLVEDAPKAGVKDNDPAVGKILYVWSRLGENPSARQRAELSAAISAWMASERTAGAIIPTAAAVALYAVEWQEGKWTDARRDAQLAAGLGASMGKPGLGIEISAKLIDAGAQFLDEKKADAWFRMADVHDDLMWRMGPPQPGEDMEQGELFLIDMAAHAWLETMGAYLDANSKATGGRGKDDLERMKERRKKIISRCGNTPCPPQPLPAGQIKQCPGPWDQTPPLKYPAKAQYRGIVGTTILQMMTDEQGNVLDAKVLAAVPSDSFREQTLSTVKKWKLRPRDTSEPCTLAGRRQLWVAYIFQ